MRCFFGYWLYSENAHSDYAGTSYELKIDGEAKTHFADLTCRDWCRIYRKNHIQKGGGRIFCKCRDSGQCKDASTNYYNCRIAPYPCFTATTFGPIGSNRCGNKEACSTSEYWADMGRNWPTDGYQWPWGVTDALHKWQPPQDAQQQASTIVGVAELARAELEVQALKAELAELAQQHEDHARAHGEALHEAAVAHTAVESKLSATTKEAESHARGRATEIAKVTRLVGDKAQLLEP